MKEIEEIENHEESTSTVKGLVKKSPAWLKIVLAIIGAGFVSHFFSYLELGRTLGVSENSKLIQEFKEERAYLKADRNFYQEKYKECAEAAIQNQADLSLLKSNVQLLVAVKNDIPLAIWTKDLELNMLGFNQHYENLFLKQRGINPLDYIGKNDYAVWPPEVARGFIKADQEVLRSEQTFYTKERVLVDTFGNYRWYNVAKYPRYLNHTLIGVGGYAIESDLWKKLK